MFPLFVTRSNASLSLPWFPLHVVPHLSVDEEGGFSFVQRMLAEGSLVALGERCGTNTEIYKCTPECGHVICSGWVWGAGGPFLGRSELIAVSKNHQRKPETSATEDSNAFLTEFLRNTAHVSEHVSRGAMKGRTCPSHATQMLSFL